MIFSGTGIEEDTITVRIRVMETSERNMLLQTITARDKKETGRK